MSITFPVRTVLTTMMLVSGSALAASPCTPYHVVNHRTTVGINVDEDWFMDLFHTFPYNEDRNYTLGANIVVNSTRFSKCNAFFKPNIGLDRFFGLTPIFDDYAQYAPRDTAREHFGIFVMISAFTPAGIRLNDPDPIFDDRPYSSIEGIGTTHQIGRGDGFEVGDRAIRTELAVGLLGMPQAHRAQAWFHQNARTDPNGRPFDPKGWTHQISDHGEPTARFAVNWKRLDFVSPAADFSHGFEGSVGYYTSGAASALVRVGKRRTPFYNFDASPLSMANQKSGPARARGRADVYLYGGLTQRLVAYNALLQGQFRHSDVRTPARNVERVITEFQTGVTLGFGWFTGTWSVLAGRTPEFRGPQARPHLWSGLSLTFGGG